MHPHNKIYMLIYKNHLKLIKFHINFIPSQVNRSSNTNLILSFFHFVFTSVLEITLGNHVYHQVSQLYLLRYCIFVIFSSRSNFDFPIFFFFLQHDVYVRMCNMALVLYICQGKKDRRSFL